MGINIGHKKKSKSINLHQYHFNIEISYITFLKKNHKDAMRQDKQDINIKNAGEGI